MNMLKKSGCFFLAVIACCGCGEEEYVYPDLITEMACLKTDSQGFGNQIITDEGKVWELRRDNCPDNLTADTLYRIYSRYVPVNETEATAYTLQKIVSPLPEPESKYKIIHTDPVSIQSIWRSGDYLNMVLQVMMKDKEHTFSFIENAIQTDKNGKKTLVLTLYHDRNGDTEAFYRKAYLSVPLWHYQDKLDKGDAILLQLNTEEEGMTSRTYTY